SKRDWSSDVCSSDLILSRANSENAGKSSISINGSQYEPLYTDGNGRFYDAKYSRKQYGSRYGRNANGNDDGTADGKSNGKYNEFQFICQSCSEILSELRNTNKWSEVLQ